MEVVSHNFRELHENNNDIMNFTTIHNVAIDFLSDLPSSDIVYKSSQTI